MFPANCGIIERHARVQINSIKPFGVYLCKTGKGNSHFSSLNNIFWLRIHYVLQGKPHTALLKFRESFACHSGRLEALYNVAVVYHDIGELDLEISLWKYILKVS
jgi:hypothetical protein